MAVQFYENLEVSINNEIMILINQNDNNAKEIYTTLRKQIAGIGNKKVEKNLIGVGLVV